MELFILSAFINTLGATLFAYLVYGKKRASLVYKLFGGLNLLVALWSISYFFWLLSSNYAQAYFWVGTSALAANFIPVFYLHWMMALFGLDRDIKIRLTIISAYIIAFILSFFVHSSLYTVGLKQADGFLYWPVGGYLHLVYILFYLGIYTYAGFILAKLYEKSIGASKVQLQYLVIGSVISFICGVQNFLPWYGVTVKPYFNLFVIVYIAIFAYAMLKYRPMDIRFMVRKYSVFTVSLFSVMVIVIGIDNFLRNYLEITGLGNFFAVLAAVIVFEPLRKWYFKIANRYLFYALYDDRVVISNLNEKLRSTIDIKKIYQLISQTLSRFFHVKSVAFFVNDENSEKYYVGYEHGFDNNQDISFAVDIGLQQKLIRENRAMAVEDIKRESGDAYKESIEKFVKFGAELIIPLVVKRRIIGIIVLGQKASKEIFDQEDMEVLSILGAQSAIVIENASLYEETKNFNFKLEQEINMATKDLLEANRQLKKLDEAKSEFVSIASHQLRTPLTVIKGYISMLLEGNFGKLNKPIEDPLLKVYESNERLIKLVENLLNVSRIESGKLQFNFTDIQIEKLVQSVADELENAARAKTLSISVKMPDKLLPKVRIDQEKIRQVLLNLVDNAIKYTEKGDITMIVEDNRNSVKVSIKDNGIGIGPIDLPNIFDKFSRGAGTMLIHTEGTGLGLYVAKEMVDSHGGDIWVESEGVGKGATFCFSIPYNKK